MGEQKRSKPRWGERRREKKRLKLERSGDSPEKQAEGKRGDGPSVRDNADRAAIGGFLAGGV
jgi:hypothetical protein